MEFRRYNKETDEKAVVRMFEEVGWAEEGPEDLMAWMEGCSAWVALINDEAETTVWTMRGHVLHNGSQLSHANVAAVVCSRLARRQGLAGRLTAEAIADVASDGVAMAGLGMFDQGFYNRLGLGTISPSIVQTFDPADLTVAVRARVPRRLSLDDCEAVHANWMQRRPVHGQVTLYPSALTRGNMLHDKKGFGLGYADGPDGTLSHHIWFNVHSRRGSGPYDVAWIVWNTREQFLELMALIKGLGDQIMAVRMEEPSGIRLQDLLRRPFRRGRIGDGGKFETRADSGSWRQMRILDLPTCLAATHLPGETLRFNLDLADPITNYLRDESPWHGIAGQYVVTLGPESAGEPGHDAALPTLQAGVGAFTRMWLGVLPATGLAVTDDLTGPDELLAALDATIRLPRPTADCDM
jgi:Acetyltransferase (GNAT) domain